MAAANVRPLIPAPMTASFIRRSQAPPTIFRDEAMDRQLLSQAAGGGMTPEQRYDEIAKPLLRARGVTRLSKASGSKKKFGGSDELRVDDRIFAMLVRGSLVIKIPRERVDSLVTAG